MLAPSAPATTASRLRACGNLPGSRPTWRVTATVLELGAGLPRGGSAEVSTPGLAGVWATTLDPGLPESSTTAAAMMATNGRMRALRRADEAARPELRSTFTQPA